MSFTSQLNVDSVMLDRSRTLLRQQSRRMAAGLVLLAVCISAVCGCKAQPSVAPAWQFKLDLEPSPPKVGPAQVSVAVSDAQGKPIEGATVRVEGNMNHAGMKPSFADLSEKEPGKYVGTLDLTMGGDWFLLVTAADRSGTKTEHKFDVPGVQAK